MSTFTADVGVPDSELFNSVMSDTQPQAEPVIEQQTEPTRDDMGRFAAKAEAESTLEQPQEQQEPEQEAPRGQIPPARLREEADRRRKAEADLAELRGQFQELIKALKPQQAPPAAAPQAPEIWEDPNKWFEHQQQKSQQEVRAHLMYNARLLAGQLHTNERVDQAVSAFDEAYQSGRIHPAEHQRIMSSPNPFHEAVQWFKKDQAASAVGDDIEAFKQKIIDDYLASQRQTQQQPAAQPPKGVVRIPSLNSTTSASSNSPGGGDMSDASLFANAMRR